MHDKIVLNIRPEVLAICQHMMWKIGTSVKHVSSNIFQVHKKLSPTGYVRCVSKDDKYYDEHLRRVHKWATEEANKIQFSGLPQGLEETMADDLRREAVYLFESMESRYPTMPVQPLLRPRFDLSHTPDMVYLLDRFDILVESGIVKDVTAANFAAMLLRGGVVTFPGGNTKGGEWVVFEHPSPQENADDTD